MFGSVLVFCIAVYGVITAEKTVDAVERNPVIYKPRAGQDDERVHRNSVRLYRTISALIAAGALYSMVQGR